MDSQTRTRKAPLIIGNCSGFFGDRFSAAKEMVEGGHIDVLVGDYLAELTMAILFKQTLKDPNTGYAHTFLKQMEGIMGRCLDQSIRVVSNAGGLNPKALAAELSKIADKLGLHPKIAYIEGDNLMPRLAELQETGETFTHLDTGVTLKAANAQPITANAYFGGFGIAKALEKGADIVVGGRIADAALVVGPSAWHFGWARTDWNPLAGAAVAGHIIECSGQATGGNYSFIDEVPSYLNVGFPIAEMHEDGSFVITKHPGTGGLVSVGTVTAQLLYEVREPRYLTPDVAARFDTIRMVQQGKDRVEVTGVCGEPPPSTTKVCINNHGGYSNSFTVLLAGIDIEKKAKIVENTLFDSIGGKNLFRRAEVQLIRSDKENPPTNEEAFAYLRLSVMDADPKKVGLFSSKLIELALCNIPGFVGTGPPAKGSAVIEHWPALVTQSKVPQKLVLGDEEVIIDPVDVTAPPGPMELSPTELPDSPLPSGPRVLAPLGRVYATRSGDKGGNANLGIWGKTAEAYVFLKNFLTVAKLREIMKDVAAYDIERYELPNLFALNFYIQGILGDGVSASLRMDPQAKTLGEYLRAKVVEMPQELL